MIYLVKKKWITVTRKSGSSYSYEGWNIIPLKIGGKLTFRKATPRSIMNFKWIHPGYEGKHFIEKGLEKVLPLIHEKVTGFVKEAMKEE